VSVVLKSDGPTCVAPIDLDADNGFVKGDAQALCEIHDRVGAVRPDSCYEH